jgi:hypothetical protein
MQFKQTEKEEDGAKRVDKGKEHARAGKTSRGE